MFQWLADTCVSARAWRFRVVLFIACFFVGLALQALYYEEMVVKKVV